MATRELEYLNGRWKPGNIAQDSPTAETEDRHHHYFKHRKGGIIYLSHF